jgi:predicted metal-binding protein
LDSIHPHQFEDDEINALVKFVDNLKNTNPVHQLTHRENMEAIAFAKCQIAQLDEIIKLIGDHPLMIPSLVGHREKWIEKLVKLVTGEDQIATPKESETKGRPKKTFADEFPLFCENSTKVLALIEQMKTDTTDEFIINNTYWLARHLDCPHEIMNKMGHHSHWGVRQAVACATRDRSLLALLAGDTKGIVGEAAKKRLKELNND